MTATDGGWPVPRAAWPWQEWFSDPGFDGSYGHTLESLRRVEPVPASPGFDERWLRWRAEAREVDSAPEVQDSWQAAGRTVSIIEYSGVDGLRLRAWLVSPERGRSARVGVVYGHGYGGRTDVDLDRVPADAAAVFSLARGLGDLNVGVGAPADVASHVLAGIADPERYVLGLCARDLWQLADSLHALVGEVPLYYVGESFGGGIGALALPWDERYVGATLGVPSFGQYDERLAVECLGSGESVRRHVLSHPAARATLRWFDASTALLFATVPVRVEAALWDQYVPPAGQFGVAAAVRDLELFVLPAGHAEYPGIVDVTSAAIEGGLAHLERCVRASGRRPVSTRGRASRRRDCGRLDG